MNNSKLNSMFNTLADEIEGENGAWQFIIDSTLFICLTDEYNNRMRIISPIDEIVNLSEDEYMKCLEANFHTALDARYAITDGILWAAYIHPLKEQTAEQVLAALSQVYSCVKTFGSEYSSGVLAFPKGDGQ